jgi:hypothetical protein
MTSNIKTNVDATKKTVTIVIDYSGEGSPSSSGKSMVFASTEGNQKIGDDLVLGLNLYRKK